MSEHAEKQIISCGSRKDPQQVLDHLRENGIKVLANLAADESNIKPSWLNEEKFIKARKVMQKFHVGVDFSSLTGLLLILQIPDALEPLLSTGMSKDIPSLFRRYLSTIIHVQSWYADDVFDPNSKGYRSIRQVRGMHKRVQQSMNLKFKVHDYRGNSRLWMTNYDISLTQFSFIGLALAYPNRCGLIGATTSELELINYYWRVLGFMMGSSDEFNICQFDNYSDIKKLNELILEQEFLRKFKLEPCRMGVEMTQAICLSLADFMPLVTFNGLALWWSDVLNFNGYKPRPATVKEQTWLKLNGLVFNSLLKYPLTLKWVTRAHLKMFESRVKHRDRIHERLERRYKANDRYTFLSNRCEYFLPNSRSAILETQAGEETRTCPLIPLEG